MTPPPRRERTGTLRAIRNLLAVAVAIALVVLLANIIGDLVDDDDQGAGADSTTIRLGGQANQPLGVDPGPATLELGDTAVDVLEQAKATNAGGHIGADDETPPTVAPDELVAGARAQEKAAARDDLPNLTPLAAPSQPGCNTRLVGNYSSRNGVRPRIIVLHYTVSRNKPGRADVDGITAYFNNRGSSASSHYVIDADGNCNYIVRETSKAWTQASFNPWAISLEQIAYGDERDYAGAAGYAKSARVVRAAARRWQIPLQRGAISGCTPTRPGVVDHRQLGSCGGGHHDVNPWPHAVGKIIGLARSSTSSSSKLTRPERSLANRRCYHRTRHLRLKGKADDADIRWARYYVRRIRARIARIPGGRYHRPARRVELGLYASGRAC